MNNADAVQKIKEALERLRPAVQGDGGDVEFIKFQEGIVYIQLHGACVGCPVSMYTVKLGIEQTLKQEVPEVIEVRALE